MAICITCIQNQRHHWQGFCESLQLLPQRDWGRGVWGEKNMWDSNDELFAHQLDKRKASKAIGAARTKIQDLKKSARHSQVVLVVKNRPANAGDIRDKGWIAGLGRFPWRWEWQPTLLFLPGESHGRGAWRATVHRVSQSQTRLKCLSTHTHARHSCDWMVVCM